MKLMILIIMIIVLLIVILFSRIKANKNKLIQINGLRYIQHLKNIITMVQQHRGLSAAWLNGDKSAEYKLLKLRDSVAEQMKALSTTVFVANDRWLAFTDHWRRLIKLENTTVGNSFEQHTIMIKNLAYLLEDTAEFSHLTADFLPQLENIGFVWRELLIATESIGQSRALGTGIAVKKFCSNVDKVRLNFLIKTMEHTTESTLKQLSYLPQEQQKHNHLINCAITNVTELINVIEQKLIQVEQVSVDNQDYFTLATNTIERMNDVFDHQVKQLHQAL